MKWGISRNVTNSLTLAWCLQTLHSMQDTVSEDKDAEETVKRSDPHFSQMMFMSGILTLGVSCQINENIKNRPISMQSTAIFWF